MQRRQLRGNDAGAIYDTCEAIARAKCQDRGGVGGMAGATMAVKTAKGLRATTLYCTAEPLLWLMSVTDCPRQVGSANEVLRASRLGSRGRQASPKATTGAQEHSSEP